MNKTASLLLGLVMLLFPGTPSGAVDTVSKSGPTVDLDTGDVSVGTIGSYTIPDSGFVGDTVTVVNRFTLREAQRLALKNNEQIAQARNQVLTFRERVTQARAGLLPKLSLRGERTRVKKSPGQFAQFTNQQQFTGALDLVQPVFHGGQLWDALSIQRKGLLRTQSTTYRRSQQILLRVARRFYSVILARKNIRVARNTLKRARDQYEQARARYKVGKVTRSAVLRTRVDVSDAQRQLTEAQNTLKDALEALAVEIGAQDVPGRLTAPDTYTLLDTGMKQFQRKAPRRRRDLQAARVGIDLAREQVNFEQADWFPDVDLRGSIERFQHQRLGKKRNWRITLQGSYPLFSGWKETSQINEARVQYHTAKQQYRRLKREVRRDVRQAYSTLTTQRSVVNTIENQVESARRNYEEVSARFKAGLANAVDVSDALTTLNESQLQLANARTTLRLDRLRLKSAVGTYAQDLLSEQVEKTVNDLQETSEDENRLGTGFLTPRLFPVDEGVIP